MIKRTDRIIALLTIIMMLFSCCVFADEDDEKRITNGVKGGAIYGYKYDDEFIIEYSDDSITSVVIPEGVTIINDYAFAHCTKLKSVKIPSSVREIGEYAFGRCKSLKKVVLPKTIKSIDVEAFGYCDNLANITFYDNVEFLDDAFVSCPKLTVHILNAKDNTEEYTIKHPTLKVKKSGKRKVVLTWAKVNNAIEYRAWHGIGQNFSCRSYKKKFKTTYTSLKKKKTHIFYVGVIVKVLDYEFSLDSAEISVKIK